MTKKEAILKDKANLPQKDLKLPQGITSKPPEEKAKVSPEGTPGKTEITQEIKPTGLGKRAICGIYDFAFRSGGPPLRIPERELFKEPADKLEVEIFRLLPEWLQALSDKYGDLTDAALGIVTAFYLIRQMRAQEFAKAPAKEPAPATAQDKPKTEPGQDKPIVVVTQ